MESTYKPQTLFDTVPNQLFKRQPLAAQTYQLNGYIRMMVMWDDGTVSQYYVGERYSPVKNWHYLWLPA